MMVYQLPNEIERIAKAGEFDEFDLNSFFKADGEYNDAQFVHKDDVQKWLDLIRGQYLPASIDDLKLGRGKPKMPFADSDLLGSLQHTLWFLPNVASCYAMKNLLSTLLFAPAIKLAWAQQPRSRSTRLWIQAH